MTSMTRLGVLLAVLACLLGSGVVGVAGGPAADTAGAASPAASDRASRDLVVTTRDGVRLHATLTGPAPLRARPTVVEFTPYGRETASLDVGGRYNYLLVQDRGTGQSGGRFDALGPAAQRDVVDVTRWACRQGWSGGRLALNGFSASAIVLYNSLHQQLPGCVRAMVTRSGTYELYRDLLVPGGISNLVPGAGVLAGIGAPALAERATTLEPRPIAEMERATAVVMAGLNAGLLHPQQDRWWRQRQFRGDVNRLPTLIIDGFFDVESRGAFQAYQRLRSHAHLLVAGGHDAAPAGTDGGVAEARRWLDHYVRGVDNGVDRHPRVQMLLADGDREDYVNGRYVRHTASDWPVPRTRWEALHLDAAPSGTAPGPGDGSLRLARREAVSTRSYAATPSLPTQSDPFNMAIVGASGPDALATAAPPLTEMNPAEGLTFTTRPLSRGVRSAGPLALRVRLASTAPETGVWAVLSDVAPDGSASPLTAGRLLTAYPRIDRDRSLVRDGRVVQPYGRFGTAEPAAPGQARTYQVELWPVGDRFRAGHRIRIQLVGTSAVSRPPVPGVNTVTLGGAQGARLMFPVLPGSDLRAALR